MLRRRHPAVTAEWLALAALLVATTMVAAEQRWLWRLDLLLYDISLAVWKRPAPDDVLIIGIDDVSLAQIGRWPWRRAVHATLINRVAGAGPRVIALDLILTQSDELDAAGDAALARAIRESGRTVLPVLLEGGAGGSLIETLPLPAFAASAAGLGHVEIALDGDGIARSVFMKEGLGRARWPHLSAAMLAVAEPGRGPALRGVRNPGSEEVPGAWVRDLHVHVPFSGPPGHIRQVSYVDVLSGRIPDAAFRNQFVLVGMTATGSGDSYPTPQLSGGLPTPGVEIVAQVLDGLRAGIGLTTLDGWGRAALCGLAVLALLISYLRLTPLQSLLATVVALVTTFVVAVVTLRLAQLWVGPAPAAVVMLICYPLWSWRRLEATQRYVDEEIARLEATPGLPIELPPTFADPLPRHAGDPIDARMRTLQRAAARLRSLRQFVADTLMSLPDATLVVDREGRVVLANGRAVEYLHAASPEALVGRSLPALLVPLGLADRFDPAQDPSAAAWSAEAMHPDGRDLLVTSTPCTNRDGQRLGVIVRLADLTALKDVERERERFLRFLSHDMRTPQASILMLLTRHFEQGSTAPSESLLGSVERLARRTLALADDFVHLARAGAAGVHRFEPLELVALADEVADESWDQAVPKRIRIGRRFDPEEAWVVADRQMLARALANLLSNAIKYSPSDSEVRIRVTASGDGYACTVEDDGEGISADALPRLYEPFARFDVDRHPDVEGTGLGLAFVKAAADRHGARLTVVSEPGQGSRFTLWLRAVPAPAM